MDILFLGSFFIFCNVDGQLSISDRNFTWVDYTECAPVDSSREIYAKAQVDPVLTGVDSISVDFLLRQITDILALKEGQSGFIKIKLLFHPGKPVCIRAIGTMQLVLNANQYEVILSHLSNLQTFSSAQMDGNPVSSIGIITMEVANKGIRQYRIANFSLSQ